MSVKVYVFVALSLTAISTTCIANPVENAQQDRGSETVKDVPVVQAAAAASSPVSSSVPVAPVVPVVASQDSVSSPSSSSASQKEPLVRQDTRGQRSYSPSENDIVKPYSQVEESLLKKLNMKCSQREPASCAMLKLITYMNRLFKKANIDVTENIEITQTTTVAEVKAEDLPRSISQESDEAQTAELLTAKLLSFIRSRALKFRLIPSLEAVVTSNPDPKGNLNLSMSLKQVSADTAEGRGKKKEMGGILAMMAMKAGMMGALALKGLALLVGKALVVAKIALLLAVIIGLKKLFHQEKHVTYEVVAQPHHTHSHVEHIEHGHGGGGGGGGGGHDSYSSGWGRSADVGKRDAHNMAYRAYIPKN